MESIRRKDEIRESKVELAASGSMETQLSSALPDDVVPPQIKTLRGAVYGAD